MEKIWFQERGQPCPGRVNAPHRGLQPWPAENAVSAAPQAWGGRFRFRPASTHALCGARARIACSRLAAGTPEASPNCQPASTGWTPEMAYVLEATGRTWRQWGRRLLILLAPVSSPSYFLRPAEGRRVLGLRRRSAPRGVFQGSAVRAGCPPLPPGPVGS